MNQNGQKDNWITSILDFALKIDTWKELAILLVLTWTGFFIWDLALNLGTGTSQIISCIAPAYGPTDSQVQEIRKDLESQGVESYAILSVDTIVSEPFFQPRTPVYTDFFTLYSEGEIISIILYTPPLQEEYAPR